MQADIRSQILSAVRNSKNWLTKGGVFTDAALTFLYIMK
nr:MAG TPA: hypothetical protein [Caudoviricetes sp.]